VSVPYRVRSRHVAYCRELDCDRQSRKNGVTGLQPLGRFLVIAAFQNPQITSLRLSMRGANLQVMRLRGLHIGIMLATVAANATEPPWKITGACLTPSGTLCRTLEFDVSGWVNQSWGVQGILRYRIHRIEAVAGDGSAMIRESKQSFRFYLIPAENYDRARIVIPVKRQTLEIEHTLKEFQNLEGLWRFNERWTADPDCVTKATKQWIEGGDLDNGFRKTSQTVHVAGIPAIEYVREFRDRDRVVSERKALAPSLGCIEVSLIRSERSSNGLPTAAHQSRLSSIVLGEPRQELFVVPPSYGEVRYYRERRSVPEWPYLPLMSFFHGN
jgi:hypothetical protein